LFPGWVGGAADPDRMMATLGKTRILDGAGRPVQPSMRGCRLCQKGGGGGGGGGPPRHSRDRLSGRGRQPKKRPPEEYSGPDQGHPQGLFLDGRPGEQAPVCGDWDVGAKHHNRATKEPMPPSLRLGQLLRQPTMRFTQNSTPNGAPFSTFRSSGHPPSPPGDLERHGSTWAWPVRGQGCIPNSQGGETALRDYSLTRQGLAKKSRRHFVRATGHRATEPGLRGVDFKPTVYASARSNEPRKEGRKRGRGFRYQYIQTIRLE